MPSLPQRSSRIVKPITELHLSDVMDKEIFSVRRDSLVGEMIARMQQRHVSHVVVLDGTQPVGMFTERDLVRLLYQGVTGEQRVDAVMSAPVVTVGATLGFRAAYVQLCLSRLRHLVVVDAAGAVVGVAAERDFLGYLGMDLFHTVHSLQSVIDRTVPLLPPATLVTEAIDRMVRERRGCVIVVEGDRPVGIFTEHQVPTVLARHADGSATTLGEVMRAGIRPITAETPGAEAVAQLVAEHIGYLAVVDGEGRACGAIARSRLLETVRTTINAEVAARQLVEDQLRTTEARLLATLERTPNVGVQWYDRNGRVQYWNPASERIYGWTAGEAHGRTLDQLILAAEDAAAFRDMLADIEHTGQALGPREFLTRHRSGESRWVESTIFAIPGSAADATLFVCMDVDITGRKRIERDLAATEERHRMAFHTSPDAINITRLSDGVYVDCNEGFLDIVGWSREEVVGHSSLELNIWADPADRQRLVECLGRDGQCRNLEARFVKKSGEFLWGLMSASSIELDGAPCVLSITRDITERKLAEDALRKLSRAVEQSPASIVITDLNANIEYVNPAFTRTTGYSLEEVKGRNPRILQSGETAPEQYSDLWEMVTSGKPWVGFLHNKRKDGTLYWEHASIAPVLDAQGHTTHYVAVKENITEQRMAQQQLEAVLREKRAILESSLVGIVELRGRVIVWSNPAFDRMFGYEPGELVGRPTRDMYGDEADYLAFGRQAYPAIAGGGGYRAEHRFKCKDGVLRWFEVGGSSLETGSDAVIWTFVSIEDRKRSEAELVRARDAAEAATQAKSAFLATMSHEIRTPMNGVLGMAQLLIQDEVSDAERRDYARTILNSGSSLLTLLNDILDLSKVESGKMALAVSVFSPAQLLDEIVDLFGQAAEQKGLAIAARWDGPADARYRGDAARLRQMLSNLVSNAIKFTERGRVAIEAGEAGRDGGDAVLRFDVVDSGIGVPLQAQAKLYQPFSQVDMSTTRKYGGTGLGLSIVRTLAELMGGAVGVESAAGQGSRFWFSARAGLVQAGAEGRQPSRGGSAAPDAAGRVAMPLSGTVLVVEDNLTNRKVVEALLRKRGLEVASVENGQEAVDAITRGPRPDLVLMDCQMPVMDGFEATGRIRQWEAAHGRQRLPIVALTAGAFEEDRDHCLAVGMDDFLAKPVSVKELDAALGNWLAPRKPLAG
jgi:nitrogen fixation negative regulator NifL